MLNNQVNAYRSNFGSYDKVDEVEEKDMVKGTVAELENGAPKEGGIVVEDAVLMPMYIKDEEEKAKFIGAKVNAVVVFNPNKAYEGAEAEIASFLKIDKEKVAETTGDFSFEIKEDFPQILQDLKYQLIKENLVKKNGLKVEDADIENFAKRVAKAQFAQYGMLSVPEDVLDNYAKDMLKNKQTLQNIIDRAVEEKLAAWLKEQVELDVKEVTADEFNKLFE